MIAYKSSIRRRIILGFCSLAFVVSALFSLYLFAFGYAIEDQFFNQILKEEAEYITNAYQTQNRLIPPRPSFVKLYKDLEETPEEIRTLYQAEPGKKEYPGEDGRHYHVLVQTSGPGFVLIGEVSQYLMVRPMTKGVVFILVISSLLMLIFACVMGYWLANKSVSPLSALANLVENAGPGSLPASFAEKFNQSEVGILARALEDAMGRIATFIEREQHFTRDASHELRTPIAVIKGALELLSKERLSAEDIEAIDRIRSAAVQMEQVVITLLELAREEAKKTQNETVHLLPLVEQTVIDKAYLIENKPMTINIEVASAALIKSKRAIIQILLSNLISNAFQYTSQGLVSIKFSDSLLTITDSGEGIDESIKPDIFNSLVKCENSSGFGIGLSIVKRLCEKQNFSIDISSTSDGTTITIDFSNCD